MTEEAIRALLREVEALQSSTDAFVELHTEDVVIVNVAGRRVVGREALRRAMDAALAAPLADVITHVEVEAVTRPAPGLAVVSCVKTIEDRRAEADQSLPTRGALTYVVVDGPDGPRIALAQTTPQAVRGT